MATASKAILDVIKAKAAGQRAQIDLAQAVQLMGAEEQLAMQEAQLKQQEERRKAQQQQQAKGGPQPPSFTKINPGDPGRATGVNPQSELDASGLASGGAGAQQALSGLQQSRAQSQQPLGGGGGGDIMGQLLGSTQGTQQPAPAGGVQQPTPGLAQAVGQQPQARQAPDRRNIIGFQSQTGGGSLAQALGRGRNTLTFESRPNTLTQFEAARLDQIDKAARFEIFNSNVETFGAAGAAALQAGYSNGGGIAGMARVAKGMRSRGEKDDVVNRDLVRSQIRAQDALARWRDAETKQLQAEMAEAGRPILSVIGNLRGTLPTDGLPDSQQLRANAFKAFKDGKLVDLSFAQELQADFLDTERLIWLPTNKSGLINSFLGTQQEGKFINFDDLMRRLGAEQGYLNPDTYGGAEANQRWLLATELFVKDTDGALIPNRDFDRGLVGPMANAIGMIWDDYAHQFLGMTGSEFVAATRELEEAGPPRQAEGTVLEQIDEEEDRRTTPGFGLLPAAQEAIGPFLGRAREKVGKEFEAFRGRQSDIRRERERETQRRAQEARDVLKRGLPPTSAEEARQRLRDAGLL
jgi:hypothetical protein